MSTLSELIMTVKWGVYCYTMGHFDQEKSKIGQRKSEENLRICFFFFNFVDNL